VGIFSWFKKPKKKYDALDTETTSDGWMPYGSSTTPDPWEILGLNARVDDLIKNDPNAERGLRVLESNIIGSGVTPQAVSKTGNVELTQMVEKALISFFDTTECDASQVNNLYGLQSVMLRELVKNGNCFLRRRYRSFNMNLTVPIQMQVISFDYLATDFTNSKTKNVCVNGIEYNSQWQPVAYHFYKKNPRESYSHLFNTNEDNTTIRVKASEICHVFRQDGVDQRLGSSWFAPVIPTMRMIANYRLNVLTKQQMQSSLTAIVTSDESGNINDLIGKKKAKSDGSQLSQIKRGQVNRFAPGETIEFPELPDLNGDTEFYKQFRLDMANGLGISYEEMSGDYGNVNYSSARMGWIAMSRNLRAWQSNIFEAQCLTNVANWFLDAMVMQGELTAAQRDDLKIKWVFPIRDMLDPVKETKSAIEKISGKIESRKHIIESGGRDYRTVMEEIAFDEKLQTELGLMPIETESEEIDDE